MEFNIFSNHAHVFPADVRQNGSVSNLMRLMDSCQITKSVVFAPFAYQLKGVGIEANAWLEKELRLGDGRLVGFGTVDFNSPNVADQVRQIKEMGFRGIKLHPAAQGFHLLSDDALTAYDEAEKQHLFLSFHTGIHWHRLQNYHVLHYDEIAYRFPTLRISLEHVGGYHFFMDAIAVIINNSKVIKGKRVSCLYAGLTSVFDIDKHRFWYMSRDRIHELLWQVGEDQLIFGLDFPYNQEADVLKAINTIKGLDLSWEQQQKMLGGNLSVALDL